MALGGTYATGTASVTNGSPTVPGTGVLWLDVVEGDWLQIGVAVAVIDSVSTDYGTITLKDNWPGSTAANSAYRILKMSWLRYDPSLTQQKLREFIVGIEQAGIFLFVSGTSPDPSLGEEGQFALKTNSNPWKLWLRENGAWVLLGTPAGLNWLGLWNGATAYVPNDSVRRLGAAYIAILANTNQPPESSPTYWDILSDGGQRYDVAGWASARPDSGEHMIQVAIPTQTTFYANMTFSVGKADTAAAASAVFSIQKNGVEFATMTFAIGATSATFVCAVDTILAPGDILSVIAPNPRDATLANISTTLVGFR